VNAVEKQALRRRKEQDKSECKQFNQVVMTVDERPPLRRRLWC